MTSRRLRHHDTVTSNVTEQTDILLLPSSNCLKMTPILFLILNTGKYGGALALLFNSIIGKAIDRTQQEKLNKGDGESGETAETLEG